MKFGLSKQDTDYIIDVLRKVPEVEKALIFGSRAMSNYKKGSDVDIALVGEKVDFSTVAKVKDKLQEESPMPYLFDIVDFTHSQSDALKEHILAHGVELFCRDQKEQDD